MDFALPVHENFVNFFLCSGTMLQGLVQLSCVCEAICDERIERLGRLNTGACWKSIFESAVFGGAACLCWIIDFCVLLDCARYAPAALTHTLSLSLSLRHTLMLYDAVRCCLMV